VWGAWVVPFVNLGFPYQVVRDISTNDAGQVTAPRINKWWTFWLLSYFVEYLGLRVIYAQWRGGVDDAFAALGLVETTNAVLCVVALVLWIGIIRQIGRDQNQLMGIAR
jgi:hypothetical protein